MTVTYGISTFGNASSPSWSQELIPNSTSMMMKQLIAIGRRTEARGKKHLFSLLPRRRDVDPVAAAEKRLPFNDDRQSLQRRGVEQHGPFAVDDAGFHSNLLGPAVPDDEDGRGGCRAGREAPGSARRLPLRGAG